MWKIYSYKNTYVCWVKHRWSANIPNLSIRYPVSLRWSSQLHPSHKSDLFSDFWLNFCMHLLCFTCHIISSSMTREVRPPPLIFPQISSTAHVYPAFIINLLHSAGNYFSLTFSESIKVKHTVGIPFKVDLGDKLFIPQIKKNLTWGICHNQSQNYYCGYKNIIFTLNLNFIIFLFNPF